MMLFAVLAILMVIASYVFVVLLAAACILLSYAVVSSESVGFQSLLLALFGVVIAGGLLWSLVPRPDKFKPPVPDSTATNIHGCLPNWRGLPPR